MAAYAALVSLLNTIHDITNHPRVSTFFDNKQIQHLLQKTAFLTDFIEANNFGGFSKEEEDLEREMASAAQAAEEAIDLHIMDQTYAETSLICSLDLQQIIRDTEAVIEKANGFKEKERWEEEEQPTPLLPPAMEIEETSMVGLDAELETLLDELTPDPKSCRKAISIVGMGGIGKSTLAKSIFESKLIKEYFDFRGWATISQRHNAQDILAQLLSRSGEFSHESLNELGEDMHKHLFGRRYLIVLDDIWSVQAWNEVSCYFPDNQNGSRIVLTTRLSNVANGCGSSLFKMRFLDEVESRKLFSEKAFKNNYCPPELRDVGEEIVKLCKGLALSVVVMGGLLSKSPRTVEYWKGVLKDIKSISEESLDILSLSYRHLPAHLKPCFLYMGVFKEDSYIRVSEVVRLWLAEGFIKPNGCRVLLEEIGKGYIKELIERNLILIGMRSMSGKIKRCRIHDLMRDLCIKVADKQQFFCVTSNYIAPNPTARRQITRCANFDRSPIPLARTLMAWSSIGQPVNQALLRVFKIPSLVDSGTKLYGNVNLRYLYYNRSQEYGPFWKLPTWASLLWNLQTLNIYSGNVIAPSEIWKMRQLRHVTCLMIYLPPCNRQNKDELFNLQTLTTAYNLRLCREVCKIIPNITKLYLCYDDGMYGYDDCLVEHLCNLDHLRKLQSLELNIRSRKWTYPDAKMNEKLAFPSSIKKLTLKGCGFHWDDLRMIGSLPLLEDLTLGEGSVSKGDRWSPITGQFLCLQFLSINDSAQILEYWDAESSHFPVLKDLDLIAMHSLKEIRLEIGDIPTLELIHVDWCSMSATISAVKIKEYQLDNGNDAFWIEVNLFESEVEDFEQSLESEGLSISNIELEIYFD